MRIPLELKLKKRAHKLVGHAQDLIVSELYSYFPETVLHGGTAIWRCYDGNRFSEDIDIYLPTKYKKDEKIKKLLLEALKAKDFRIEKFKQTKNAIYAKFFFNGTVVRLEILFKDVKNKALKEYEVLDGTYFTVYTLSPEDLLLEKVQAYGERVKVRDLYDIFFLLRWVKERSKVIKALREFLASYKEPKDAQLLKSIIIFGLSPNPEELIQRIRKWVK